MKTSYSYETKATVTVPEIKDSEPALQQLYKARNIRWKRERSFGPVVFRRKEKITEYLDALKDEIQLRSNILRFEIYEIGKLLCEAKSFVERGKFNQWINENLNFSKSTALNCMRVYRTCMGQPEMVENFNPSALYVICAPRFSKELREALFDNAEGKYNIKQKDLLKVALKWKEGKVTLESEEVQQLLQKQQDKDVFKRISSEMSALRKLLEDRKQKIETLCIRRNICPVLEDKEKTTHDWSRLYKQIGFMIEGFLGEIEATLMKIQLDLEDERKKNVNIKVTPKPRSRRRRRGKTDNESEKVECRIEKPINYENTNILQTSRFQKGRSKKDG